MTEAKLFPEMNEILHQTQYWHQVHIGSTCILIYTRIIYTVTFRNSHASNLFVTTWLN